MKFRFPTKAALLAFAFTALFAVGAKAQTEDEKIKEIETNIDGLGERATTLEASIDKIKQLKISGYVQPQWVWSDIDSLGNQSRTRSFFQIRRGRVKFSHLIPIDGTTGSIGAVVYPDITEAGLVIKEVYATWNVWGNLTTQAPEFAIQMGSMNRPFGYEIAYSSSARELVERSTAENRLFNGERDLGLQVAYAPAFGDIKPVLELGIFNGSDNFGKGPIVGGGSASAMFFGSGNVIGATAAITASGADSAHIVAVNTLIPGMTTAYTTVDGIRQDQKEFIGHLRLPFLISDELSLDVGGSWSIGGITPVSDVVAEYSGTNGALKLSKAEGATAPHKFNPKSGWAPSGILNNNRTIMGGDLQVYLSVLPFGGTILKGELYTGAQPFYGTAALYGSGDTATLGAPTAVLVKKSVMGFYGMLIQNITDNFQLVVRYDSWDPNTNFKGTDAADMPKINGQSYIKTNADLGGDLALNTLAVGVNAFIGGSLRLMFDYEMPKLEEYTKKVSGNNVTVGDPHDDRFTFRMQYKF